MGVGANTAAPLRGGQAPAAAIERV